MILWYLLYKVKVAVEKTVSVICAFRWRGVEEVQAFLSAFVYT